MLAAGLFAATSCSDFSDYNDVPVDVTTSGNQTLWENISTDPQLQNFAELVKRTGYDTKLSEARAFTVWAPVDGTYDAAAFRAMSDSMLLQQFVLNHIAEYAFGANGKVEERIHTLNDKSYMFVGDGSYKFGNIDITKANQPSSNGLMHYMNGIAKFYPNLFEYLNMADGVGSLRNYFMQYNDTTLSDESVKGPMVNGVQTYLDSVLVINNTLMRGINASLQNEDSSYTFLMPTDDAYQKLYDRIKPFYNFIGTTAVQNVADPSYSSATTVPTMNATVDAAYLSDSLTRRAIVRNLVYSNNDAYNQWIVGGPHRSMINPEFKDSIRSTVRNKFSNPDDIMEKYMVGEPVELSNGYARFVDSLAFYPWETYNPMISFNPRGNFMVGNDMRTYLARTFTSTVYNHVMSDSLALRVLGPEWGANRFSYYWIEPNSKFAKPDFFISLPNVLSTTYNFYVVFLPSAWPVFGGDERPNKLNFQLSYCKADGKLETYNFSKANAELQKNGGEVSNKEKGAASVTATTAFENDPHKTDTLFIGRFTFPVAYKGLGDAYMPNLHVTTPINALFAAQEKANTRDVRILGIIMKPVDYEEFEANNK